MKLWIALSDDRARELVASTLRRERLGALWIEGSRSAPLPADETGVLVHDLLPDPEIQIDWLGSLLGIAGVSMLLLLPLSRAVLRTAVCHAARLPLADVDLLTPELTPALFAAHLHDAMKCPPANLAVWRRVQRWPLPAGLHRLAEATLHGPRPHPRVGTLTRLLGLPYEAARREAVRAGVDAPGTFTEMLRLLCASVALGQGLSVRNAALDNGFRDAEHLRVRLRRRLDVTPSRARDLGWETLCGRVELSWFGGV